MSEFGGLWKHQNNPACTKSVKSLQNVEVGHYIGEEEEGILKQNLCFRVLISISSTLSDKTCFEEAKSFNTLLFSLCSTGLILFCVNTCILYPSSYALGI